jgi:hypothetical protein
MSRPPEPQSLDFLLAQVSRLYHQDAHELLEKLGLYRGQSTISKLGSRPCGYSNKIKGWHKFINYPIYGFAKIRHFRLKSRPKLPFAG